METYVALASHHKTAVAVGDRGQKIYPQMHLRTNTLQAQSFPNLARATFAKEMRLTRTTAAPGAPNVAAMHHLTRTKRFGNPLAKYTAQGHPNFCPSSTHRRSSGRRQQ